MTGRHPGWLALLLVFVGLLGPLGACGGPASRLIKLHGPGTPGAIAFALKNATSASINALYFAKTERVTAAGSDVAFDSPEGKRLWGSDLLSHAALGAGDSINLDVPGPGLWDAWVVDRDDRYQHVTGLRLAVGGRYVLELNEGGWRVR